MSKKEYLLDQCLGLIHSNQATVEDCLEQYPELAEELNSVLFASQKIGELSAIQPDPAFKAKTRGKLLMHMETHPKRRPSWGFPHLLRWNLAARLAVLGLFGFATTTAFAQYALPGHVLYGWKRTSESVWRAVSPDLLNTDLAMADRRLHEYINREIESKHRAALLNAYSLTLSRISEDLTIAPKGTNAAREKLEQHQKILNSAGIHLGSLDNLIELLILATESPSSAPINSDGTPSPDAYNGSPYPEGRQDSAVTGTAAATFMPPAADSTNALPENNGGSEDHPSTEGKGKPPEITGKSSTGINRILGPIRDFLSGILP